MLKPGDRVTYFGQDGVVTSELGALGWYHVELARGDKIHAPASAFVKVEEEKPEQFKGNLFYDTNGGPSIMIADVPLICTEPRKITLDTARIAAPVVLEKLRKIRDMMDPKGVAWEIVADECVILNQEIADAK